MKKRIACFIMTLIMLVSLVPTAAISASAASYTVSEAAITVLKKMVSYNRYCYQVADTSEFRIGYGTLCTEKHKWVKVDAKDTNGKTEEIEVLAAVNSDGSISVFTTRKASNGETGDSITAKDNVPRFTKYWTLTYNGKTVDFKTHYIGQSAADAALRKNLAEVDKNVGSFASSNNVTLNQNKHDALVVLTYLTGSAWMSGTNATKTAIINNAGSAELLGAMAKNYGSSAQVEARSKVLVNMYMNGVYANIAPTSYAKVTYDPTKNGSVVVGVAGKPYEYYFDTTREIGHPVVATRTGYTFVGWYLPNSDSSKTFMPKLTAECAGKTLVAQWQEIKETSSSLGTVVTMEDLADRTFYKNPNNQSEEYGQFDAAVYDKIKISTVGVGDSQAKWARIAGGDALHNKNKDKWESSGKAANMWVKLNSTYDVAFTETSSVWNVSQLYSKDLYTDPNTNSWADSGYNLANSVVKIQTDKEYVDANGVRWAHISNVYDENNSSLNNGKNAIWYKDGKAYQIAIHLMWVRLNTGANGGISIGAASGAVAKATITAKGYVNVRSGAGTNNPIVGSVRNGETVDVFEIVTCNGHKWGRINGGWICLTYASVTLLQADADVDVSSEGALAYTYNGFVSNAGVKEKVYVAPRTNSNLINAKYRETLQNGTNVTVTNMTLSPDQTLLWVKIRWTANYTDELGNKQSALASGWVQIESNSSDKGYADSVLPNAKVTLGASSSPIQLWPVRYTVSANELTVRNAPGSGAGIAFKMNRGVQFDAWEFCMVGEELWGFCREVTNVNDKYEDETSNTGYECGWANLSSKYVSRTSLPDTGSSGNALSPIGKTATIVNTDSVRVRITGALYGRQLGTLPRGTTANILEIEDGWYNLDIDVDDDPETGSWVFEDYVQVNDGYVGTNGGNTTTVTNPDGTTTTTTTEGKGIVANTYSGVNFRSGAGIGSALLGKLLPGTVVDILETKNAGAAKWGRVNYDGKEGWVCMDYITMISTTTTTTTTTTGNGTGVKDFSTLDKTTTTAVYTGSVVAEPSEADIFANGGSTLHVWTTPKHNLTPEYSVFELNPGDPVTIYELLAVTESIENNNTGDDSQVEGDEGHGSTAETTVTSYWARTSDGYIYNPQDNLKLNPLDEVWHTLTGSDTLNVRDSANGNIVGELEKGDQVKVTNLEVVNDKVWGQIEYDAAEENSDNNGFSYGWVRLDYFSEGAYYEQKVTDTQTNTTNNGGATGTNGNVGNTGNTGGGLATNAGGYRYTGKVINTNEVNVRQTASQTAPLTTKLKNGASLVIYETTISENMAWGRCDAGWVYLYYVDLTPATAGLVDARVVYNDNTIIYSDSTGSSTVGTYARMSVIDIYEIVGKMARTDQGWVNTDNLL